MPTKEATVRVKIVGVDDSGKALDAMAQKIVKLNRSTKMALENNASGSKATQEMKEASIKYLMRDQAQFKDALVAVNDTKTKSRMELLWQSIDRSAQKQRAYLKPMLEKMVEHGVITPSEMAQSLSNISEQAAKDKWNAVIDERKKKGGGKDAGAMSGFGGKMILGGAAGQMIHAATGSGELGGMAAGISSGFMFGGPLIGSLVSGMFLAGMAVEGWRNKAKASAEATIAFTSSLSDLASRWSNLSTSLIERNPFGKAMQNEFQSGLDSASKAIEGWSKTVMEGMSASDWLMSGSGNSAFRTKLDQYAKEYGLQKAVAEKAKEYRDNEFIEQFRNDKRNIELQKELANSSKNRNSVEREREQIAIKRKAEFNDRKYQYEMELRQNEASKGMLRTTIASLGVEIALLEQKKKAGFGGNFEASRANEAALVLATEKKTKAELELRQAETATPEISIQYKVGEQKAAAEISRQVNEREREYLIQKQNALRVINAESAVAVDTLQKQVWMSMGMTKDQAEQLTAAKYILRTEQETVNAKYASHQISMKEAAIQRMMKEDKGAKGTSKEIEIGRLAQEQENVAVNTQLYQLQIAREANAIQEKYLTGKKTLLEMEQAIAVAQNPLAKDRKDLRESIEKSAAESHNLALRKKFMSPLEQFKLEKDQILEALNKGFISPERARHLLQVGVNQVGNFPTGQFGSMSSRWQEIQSAALRPEDDTQRLMYEELKGLREVVENLRAAGIPIKGGG